MGAGGKLQNLGPFNRGVNNRRPEFDLRTKEGDFLRAGVNVDISNTGSIKRRQGYAAVLDGADCHSLFAVGGVAYYVDGHDLLKVTGLDATPAVTTLKADMAAGRHVSYCAEGDSVYFTNTAVIGRLDSTGAHPLGCPGLDVEPVATAGSGGSLAAGRYQVCVCYVNAAGEQSGTTWPQSVEVVNGAITLFGLPAAFPADVTGLMVFASPLNSDLLMHVMTLSAAQVSLTIAAPMVYGARCQTLMLDGMPPGSIVRQNAGRLLVASGNTLVYSEPYAYALTKPDENYIPFNAPITVMEPVVGGLYVVAEQAYFLPGDITSTSPVVVLPYGAVAGTGGHSRDSNTAWWMSQRGMVTGNAAGEVKNLQEDQVAVDPAPVGASLFRESNGLKQILSSMFNPEISGAAARSYMEAEIVRKGTVL